FKKVRNSIAQPKIQPSNVAASEGVKGAQSRLLHGTRRALIEARGAFVIDKLLVVSLYLQTVDEAVMRLPRNDTHDAKYSLRIVADQSHGQLIADDELFDEHRLLVDVAEFDNDGRKVLFSFNDAFTQNSLA